MQRTGRCLEPSAVRFVRPFYLALFVVLAALFALCAIGLIVIAGTEMWSALRPAGDLGVRARFDRVLEAIAVLTIAVASLELSQTVLEEEVHRTAQLSSPTRVRRFLSRFLVVITVASGIEFLVAVFQLSHEDPGKLPHAAAIGLTCAVLVACWGYFLRANRTVERLEPEALAKAKAEDHKVE
jgi:hypothetical protein